MVCPVCDAVGTHSLICPLGTAVEKIANEIEDWASLFADFGVNTYDVVDLVNENLARRGYPRPQVREEETCS